MTTNDDLSLFGDEDHTSSAPTGITMVEDVAKKNDTAATRLWKLWVSLSHTPTVSPTQKFCKAVDKAMRLGKTENTLRQLLPLALYSTREFKDVADDRRVIRVISFASARAAARALRTSKSRIYRYDDVNQLVSLEKLWHLCRLDRDALPTLSDAEMQAAIKLTYTRDEEWLTSRVSDIREQLGRPVAILLPSDIVRGFPRGVRGTANSGRLALAHGAHTTSGKDSESLPLDRTAEDMLLDGVQYDDVVRFHQRVPTGFWTTVLDLVEEGASSDDAIRAAEKQYEFALTQRDRSV